MQTGVREAHVRIHLTVYALVGVRAATHIAIGLHLTRAAMLTGVTVTLVNVNVTFLSCHPRGTRTPEIGQGQIIQVKVKQ